MVRIVPVIFGGIRHPVCIRLILGLQKGEAMKAALIYLCILIVLPLAAYAENRPFEMSGFFDVLNRYGSLSSGEKSIQFNQAELDISHQITDQLLGFVAVCYDNDAEAFCIGAAYADFQMVASANNSAGIIAGQFDVPFGIDYLTCTSIMRKTVSTPLVVSMTHGGWNDVGMQFYAGNSYGNITAYAVNGFADQATETTLVWNLATSTLDETIEDVDLTPRHAYGGRIGLKPLAPFNAEFGSSLAVGLNDQHRTETYLYGFDGTVTVGNGTLKGEYIYHSRNRSRQVENNYGYYLQGEYQFGRMFVVSRFDAVTHQRLGQFRRETLGAGFILHEGTEFRFEYQNPDKGLPRVAIAQLVVSL